MWKRSASGPELDRSVLALQPAPSASIHVGEFVQVQQCPAERGETVLLQKLTAAADFLRTRGAEQGEAEGVPYLSLRSFTGLASDPVGKGAGSFHGERTVRSGTRNRLRTGWPAAGEGYHPLVFVSLSSRKAGFACSTLAGSSGLAGGGVRRGQRIGATESPVQMKELHATILAALGLEHESLFFNDSGRQECLTGIAGGARVIPGVL